MTKWEYCAINANMDTGKKILKLFKEEAPQEIENVHKTMVTLGEDGWELVNLTQISQPNARVYYFKRPIV